MAVDTLERNLTSDNSYFVLFVWRFVCKLLFRNTFALKHSNAYQIDLNKMQMYPATDPQMRVCSRDNRFSLCLNLLQLIPRLSFGAFICRDHITRRARYLCTASTKDLRRPTGDIKQKFADCQPQFAYRSHHL